MANAAKHTRLEQVTEIISFATSVFYVTSLRLSDIFFNYERIDGVD